MEIGEKFLLSVGIYIAKAAILPKQFLLLKKELRF